MNDGTQREHRWIAIGDIHDDSMDKLAAIPELSGADGLIITGDLTNIGGEREAARVLGAARRSIPVAAALFGNMDKAEVAELLDREGINIHASARLLAPGLAVVGVGGSTPTPFGTPREFSEADYATWLENCRIEAKKLADQMLLVSHNPPKNTKCDRIGAGAHVGSEAVRAFIEAHQHALCLCGHIHEARATDAIGATQVINPGNFGAGGYIVLSYVQGRLAADLRIL
ncbi:MAG: metallophosphoesterase [Deltaproteobacteria bacterium]|jgi:Icc-related predicted phosphoesterase|nr:metallophosphoesterase [Deltaproteobacteria bacterium]